MRNLRIFATLFVLFCGLSVSSAFAALPAGTIKFDFDGDGKADIARWKSSSLEWKIKNSSNGSFTTHTIGSSGSIIAPGDFDGDGITDAAVFNAGTWTIKKSSNGQTQTVTFGTTGDKPVVGDYDGDGKSDCAIFRPSTNTWWILYSSNGSYVSAGFGNSGDITAQGNFDGDSKTDIAVFRPSTGDWHIQGSTVGYFTFHWGIAADIPVPADFDGDGKTDIAVYRGSTGIWYVSKSSTNNTTYIEQGWGNFGDQPTPADYDNDGKADFAIWRPTTGMWYIIKSSNSTYDYPVLGVAGDTAVQSAYLKQIGSYIYSYDFAKARLSPKNATGGTNLYSRNFSWGTSLVGLSGRAGMSAGLGISYNSLVWTKDAASNTVVFDADNSNVTPGFRLGFPTVEPVYYDGQTSKFSFLMVAPSGARVEFRQSAASNTYETADSSYTQLKINGTGSPNDPAENLSLTVTGTDGTNMLYEWKNGAYHCKEIKDRNGNFITITHDANGYLQTVKDTLGRIITVNYAGGDSYPTSITQTWKNSNGHGSDVTHTWATFTYTTQQIYTNFSNLTVIGPGDGYQQKVLQKITYSNSSSTTFDYNTWGQVKQINNYAADTHKLNHVKINLPADATNAQTDCPRFTQTENWAENFNGGNPTVISNSITENQSYSTPAGSGTATKIEVSIQSDPHGSISKTFVGGSGWNESLPIVTEDWATEGGSSVRKRWTWKNWTQDDTNLSYILNPRVTETKVGDAANTKRTMIYHLMQSGNISQFGLVNKVEVYDASGSTVLKTQTTDYNLSSTYTSRRIIGLPMETRLYEGTDTGTPVSKLSFEYDENGYAGTGQSISATQHDAANYGTGFNYRGNQTRTRRWDATNPTTEALSVSSQVKYNIAGSPISGTDPRGRVSSISYDDVWNDSVSRSATYAYPTTVTDSGGFSSNVKYRYDIGANVWAQSPTPSGANNGKTSSRTYDDEIGRIARETVDNTGAYTRYDYPNDGASLNTFTTIVDFYGDGVDSGDEVQTETLFDGAGRVRKTRTENPNSIGGWTGKLVEYNILGQLKRETVPTEIEYDYDPAGDDSAFLWKELEYDWKGRVTREINTDGTDKLYSYEGCGCAGGQVTTIKGEITTATDVAGNQQTTKRRTQKIYADILGRTVKTEIWDLDGGGSAPYSTVVNTYNGRDQITNIREYSGSSSSSTFQDTTMTYDGHGRLSMRHRPEEFDSANNNALTYTTYTYKTDDSVASVTDPRSAVTTYSYGNYDDANSSEYRTLPTKIHYYAPSGIIVPADVNFTYDAAGNRTYMSDGTGNLTYSYDELSRLKTETKDFLDTLSGAPDGVYKLKYNYHLTGGIKSIEDPFGAVVSYNADKTGRTIAVGGSNYFLNGTQTEITSYATSINYRAFGGVKSMTYTTTQPTQISLGYNTRLLPSSYEADSDAVSGDIQNVTYSYQNDGSIKEAVNAVQSNYSQYYDYDFAGRLKRNEFGGSGSGKPYKQTLGYDAFSNISSRSTWTWGTERSFTAGYTNNRKTSGGYQSGTNYFDIAGNIVQSVINSSNNNQHWKFDAAGRMTDWEEAYPFATTIKDDGALLTFDGDGRAAKRLNRYRNRANGNTTFSEMAEYDIFSSVTGQKITNLNDNGGKVRTSVYMGKTVIAEQWLGQILFKYNAPVTGSVAQGELSGELSADGSGRVNTAALGINIPPVSGGEEAEMPDYTKGGHTRNPESGCQLSGGGINCNRLSRIMRSLDGQYTVEDLSRGNFTNLTLIYHYWETPAAPTKPPEPEKREPDLQIGSYAEWYELRVELPDAKDLVFNSIDAAKGYLKSNKDCANFLNKVLENVRPASDEFSQYTMRDDAKDSEGRMYIVTKNISEMLDLAKRASVVETGKGGVVLQGGIRLTNDLSASPGVIYVNKPFATRTPTEKIFAVIHESFHQLKGVDDFEIARAAQLADGVKEENLKIFDPKKEGASGEASSTFNQIVARRCSGLSIPNTTTIRF